MQLFYLHSIKTSWHNNLNCVFSASMLRNLTHNGGLSIYSFIQCGQWGEGAHLSLVWISKAVVSRIEDETMLLSVLYYNCINILSFSLSPIHSSYVAVSRPDVACRNLTTPPPPFLVPWDDLQLSTTTGILQKKSVWFIGVEVKYETGLKNSC